MRKFSNDKSSSLGVYLSTPTGEPLGVCFPHTIGGDRQAEKFLAILEKGVVGMGNVKPRTQVAEPKIHPDRGVGERPDGSVRLALWVRFTDPAPHGKHAPVFDSIVLDAKQWRSLVPAKRDVGTRYSLKPDAVNLFCRALVASSDLSFTFRPQDVQSGAIDAEVVSAQEIVLRGTLKGRRSHVNEPNAPNDGTSQFEGRLTLDAEGKIKGLLLVGTGGYQQPWNRSPRPIASVIEWRSTPDGD